MPSTHVVVIVADLALILLTGALFAYLVHAGYPTKAAGAWNGLHGLVLVTLALTLNTVLPQFFMDGRTEAQCRFLQHWAGSFYNISNGLSRTFFVIRSNHVLFAPSRPQVYLYRALLTLLLLAVGVGVVHYNLGLRVALLPPTALCTVHLVPSPELLLSILIPFVIATIANLRFVLNVARLSRFCRRTGALRHPDQVGATLRLLRVTCAMGVLALGAFVLEILFVFDLIAVANRALLTPIYTLLQVVNACTPAWPVILIQLRKIVVTGRFGLSSFCHDGRARYRPNGQPRSDLRMLTASTLAAASDHPDREQT